MNIYGLKQYCCEDFSNIEGYKEALENPNIEYHCHHRLEIQEDKVLSVKELKELNLYYNRPASELIILTKQDHLKLHSKARHREYTEGRKQYFKRPHVDKELASRHKSEAWDYDKHFTTETRKKISEACKGEKNGFYGKKHSEESKQKMREYAKNRKPISEETRKKMKEAQLERWRKRKENIEDV